MLRLALLFLLGAVLGTALDHLHVATGVLAYPAPAFWGEALWVPALFGGAALLFVHGGRSLFFERGAAARLPLAVAYFVTAHAVTGLWSAHPMRVLVVLAGAWLAWMAWLRSGRAALYGLCCAIGGSAFESALSHTGAFHYLHPDVLLVPIWLPALYLHASLATRALAIAVFPAPATAPSSSVEPELGG